jgi:DNA-binding MarR family transcriptional regulator
MNDDRELAKILRELMETFFMRSMEGFKKHIKASGLTMPQIHLLMFLHHGGDKGVHDIGDRMDITSAGASQLVDRLVNAGLVERSEDPEDRRGRKIALTRKGREFVEKSGEERYGWVDGLVDRLDAKARAAVRQAAPPLLEAAKYMDGTGQSGPQYGAFKIDCPREV